ncbi:MAG TPA: hypothetical protein VKK31_26205 [Thermoanaerobaculia bacterium]|nr:hypothetical protein [Thermoanaerobaculia bacterium]
MEASLQLEAGEVEKLGGLAQADLVGEIGPQSPGVLIFSLPLAVILLDCTLGERLKKAEIHGIQQNDLLFTRSLDDGDLPVSDPVDDLLSLS